MPALGLANTSEESQWKTLYRTFPQLTPPETRAEFQPGKKAFAGLRQGGATFQIQLLRGPSKSVKILYNVGNCVPNDRRAGRDTYHTLTDVNPHNNTLVANKLLQLLRDLAAPTAKVKDLFSGARIKERKNGRCRSGRVNERRALVVGRGRPAS